MSDEPKPCQFCGGEASRIAARQRDDGTYYPAACGCGKCGIWRYGESDYGHSGFATEEDFKASMEQAVLKWNTRAEELEPDSNLLEPKRCELEETESYECRLFDTADPKLYATRLTVHVLECSECGRTCEHVNGTYPRCPYCSAVNVLDENYEQPQVIANAEKYKLSHDDGVERSDDGVDSREELESDIREWIDIATYKAFTPDRMLGVMLHWLDRQKRITIREHQEGCKYKAKADELQERVDSLTVERDELKAENKRLRDSEACVGCEDVTRKINELTAEVAAQRKRANDAERGVLDGRWYVSRDRYEDDIAELTAERDEWQRTADDYKERKDALVAERDELRAQLDTMRDVAREFRAERNELREKNARQRRQLGELQDAIRVRNQGELKRQWRRQVDDLTAENSELRKRVADLEAVSNLRQRVIEIQRDSFLKLEVENAELRKELARWDSSSRDS